MKGDLRMSFDNLLYDNVVVDGGIFRENNRNNLLKIAFFEVIFKLAKVEFQALY